jgi:CheY-like chemotaxis protein
MQLTLDDPRFVPDLMHPTAGVGISLECDQNLAATGRRAVYSRPVMSSGLPPPLRILIASSDRLFTRRLFGALMRDGRSSVVGTAASEAEAVAIAEELSPDLLFLDENLPPSGPLAVLEAVAEVSAARAIVLVEQMPEVDWDSLGAQRILAFAPRNGGAPEVAPVAYEVAALSLALGPRVA